MGPDKDCFDPVPFKLETMKHFPDIFRPNHFIFKLDFKAAYHNFLVRSCLRELFGLEFEGNRLADRRTGTIGHRNDEDGQEGGGAEGEGGQRAANPIEEPLAETGLNVGEPIFALQNRGHCAECVGKDFELFELLLTIGTDEEVLFNGGGGRFGDSLQHVLFELLFCEMHCGRLKQSRSPFYPTRVIHHPS